MHYKVIFRVEEQEQVKRLAAKIKNYRAYLKEKGDSAEIETVFLGSAVLAFKDLPNEFTDIDLDVALCRNSLQSFDMEEIQYENIRTVAAGIGEVIERKAEGYIEYFVS